MLTSSSRVEGLAGLSTARHWMKRADGVSRRASLFRSMRVHGLQLRSGLSTFPLRAYRSKLPRPRTSARPQREKILVSCTSLSKVPSGSGELLIRNTLPRLLVEQYRPPLGDLVKAITSLALALTRSVKPPFFSTT